MKMSHGGFVPAYNVQTVADAEMGLIVTVAVTDRASDNGLLLPMLERMEAATGRPAEQALVDAGSVNQEDIAAVEAKGTKLYMPPKNEQKELKAGKDPYAAKRRDSPPVANWRMRMARPRPVRFPGGGRRWPRACMPSRVMAVGSACVYAASRRRASKRYGKRWPTTCAC